MENETLKEIKTEITAIRKVINSDFEGIGHAEDRIALDLRLQQQCQSSTAQSIHLENADNH